MTRKDQLYKLALAISFVGEIYLIWNLFYRTKTWTLFGFAVAGFVLIPVTFTLFVRTTKLQPTHKVIVITGIWVAWVVLAGLAALATYYAWSNGAFDTSGGVGGGCSPSGLCY